MTDTHDSRDLLTALYHMIRLFRMDIVVNLRMSPLDFQIGKILCDYEKEKQATPITARELAKRAHIAPSSLTRVLNKLEKQGYIHRTIPSENRRIVFITLASKAKNIFQKLHKELLSYMDEMTSRLGKEDTSSLITLLQKFGKVLEEMKKEKEVHSLCCN